MTIEQGTGWTPDNIEKIINVVDRLGWVVPAGLFIILVVIVVGIAWIYLKIIAPLSTRENQLLQNALILYEKEKERRKELESKNQELELQIKLKTTSKTREGKI